MLVFTAGWSSGFKLLHSQVQAKKKALQSGGPKVNNSQTVSKIDTWVISGTLIKEAVMKMYVLLIFSKREEQHWHQL